MITLEETKKYLRVDHDDEDDLIKNFINTAYDTCISVARINGQTNKDKLDEYPNFKTELLYKIAYLYENRENANHKELNLTLRALLLPIREDGF